MTLDREERKTRLERARGMCALRGYEDCVCDWLREAHARIDELEEALHARRLRCEELEEDYARAWRIMRIPWQEMHDRAQGYRKAAIILRDLWRDATNDSGRKKQV